VRNFEIKRSVVGQTLYCVCHLEIAQLSVCSVWIYFCEHTHEISGSGAYMLFGHWRTTLQSGTCQSI